MESTQEGFIEFVMSQPQSRKIDNDSWGTCAVGNYLDSIESSENSRYFANHVLEFSLMLVLNERDGFKNYRELQDFLKD